MLIDRYELEALLANVVAAGDRVFTAGAIADDTSLDVAGQTRQALADVDKYLALCGSNKRQVLMAVIWLADIRLRDEMNGAWIEWVDPAQLPARACIEAKMAHPRCLVEIAIIAARSRASLHTTARAALDCLPGTHTVPSSGASQCTTYHSNRCKCRSLQPSARADR